MRNKLSFVFLSLVTLFSCKPEVVNVNNNNPSNIPLPGLLPSAEVALAYNLASDFSIRSSIFVQYISGIGGFAVNDDRYNFSTDNFNGAWGNAYTRVLNNLSVIIKNAEASGANYYAGIGKVLTAITLGNLTDAYGDIPYTEALNPQILSPKYERQDSIYKKINLLIDAAIIDFQETSGGIIPANDDIIFKGNITKWIAAAYTLKARYALHLSKENSQQAAQQVLAALYDNNIYRGIQNNAGDVEVTFGTANNQASPWYTQDAGRPGWYGMGAYFVNLLNGNPPSVPVDPRRAAFAAPRTAPAPANTYVGSPAGNPVAASNIVGSNTYYGRSNSPVSILTYAEAKFIEAEARLLLNQSDASIQSTLETAVRASFTKVTAATDTFATTAKQNDYISKRATLSGTANQKLQTIITQKYIALYLNPEAWVDFRRTGYPALTPATGGATSINPTGAIPRRLSYPNSEVTLNPNVIDKSSNLQSPKLWWDK